MAVGSSFDAYAKSYLYKALVGKGDPKYEFQSLFETQVEIQNRDLALVDGKYVFDEYMRHGAMTELLLEMKDAMTEPRFEFEVESILNYNGKEVKLLGKPDIFFLNKEAAHITIDWKVNGFYSKSKTYPKTGYVRVLPGRESHRDAFCMMHKGIMINAGKTLDTLDETWAAQLSIYSWLCGCEIGSDWIAGIDQIAAMPGVMGKPPILKIAQHRLRCDRKYQIDLITRATEIWEIVNSDWIFREMSHADSISRCEILDLKAAAMATTTEEEKSVLIKRAW